MTDSLLIAVYAFANRVLMTFSVDIFLGWWDTASFLGEIVY